MKSISLQKIRKRILAQPEKYLNIKKQRGMTLLEIIIVLGIIGTIAAGVVILAQRAFDTKAITDLATNANSVRVAMKDAYGPTGEYPSENNTATAAIKNSADLTKSGVATPIGKLAALGKISADEALNSISSNYINIGAGKIGGKDSAGYYIVLNGLSKSQCRGLLNQVANQWDYVSVSAAEQPAGTYTATGIIDLGAAVNGLAVDADGKYVDGSATADGIYRSLDSAGDVLLTPDAIVGMCHDNNGNAIILGSR
ncbi:prepilin-type N-terminal cleavage/methylation domain-containing protein [Proteus columbae]|uniref:prepilin-type N-terminal cleavage/methylation domain-containing protein n=1 Tax=Proteus columbae TaxID=1987580 RepID=UPI001F325995|nr:prepilin-type N-terminal cleavage/methylation domain-containing protein [Proteus columbae]MCF1957670.1 prepilin-type N-terminal cleavage/methylation domain-containing protein [Escherichia coli]